MSPISRQAWQFETVIVDRHGEIAARTLCQAEGFIERLRTDVTLEMVEIPGGSFHMGSPSGQGYPDEHPSHFVRVPGFYIGRHTVTQAQWDAVMPDRLPFRCPGPDHPADRVSWHAAVAFCERLRAVTSRPYRLPSEAEWEYACRAGSTTPFHFGATLTTDLANYVGEHLFAEELTGVYRHCSTEVGSFPPNAFGLYDMHGNVWEWCRDAWHDDYEGAPTDGSAWEGRHARNRTVRGGSWHEPPDNCRSAVRLRFDAAEGEDFIGFRVALSV